MPYLKSPKLPSWTRKGACLSSLMQLTTLSLLSCSGPDQYGFSRLYSPLTSEKVALKNATEYDPIMLQRFPQKWHRKQVQLFGIVKQSSQHNGSTRLTLSLRSLATRNLCNTQEENTCRVTVGDREHVVIQTDLRPSQGSTADPNQIQPGSLVRVVGQITRFPKDPKVPALIAATYFRHWPKHFFVTTDASSYMLR